MFSTVCTNTLVFLAAHAHLCCRKLSSGARIKFGSSESCVPAVVITLAIVVLSTVVIAPCTITWYDLGVPLLPMHGSLKAQDALSHKSPHPQSPEAPETAKTLDLVVRSTSR